MTPIVASDTGPPGFPRGGVQGRAFRRHVQSLLRETGAVGDHALLTHALLASVDLETLDHLRAKRAVEAGAVQGEFFEPRGDGRAPRRSRVSRSAG